MPHRLTPHGGRPELIQYLEERERAVPLPVVGARQAAKPSLRGQDRMTTGAWTASTSRTALHGTAINLQRDTQGHGRVAYQDDQLLTGALAAAPSFSFRAVFDAVRPSDRASLMAVHARAKLGGIGEWLEPASPLAVVSIEASI